MTEALTTRIEHTLLEQQVATDVATLETIGTPRQPTNVDSLPALQVQTAPGVTRTANSEALVLTEVLGRGGMGAVHLARQPSLERDVAVKLLHARSEQHAERLVFEARITGRLEHPNVVPVHSLGLDTERGPVVVMKRVVGRSWDALLREEPGAAALTRHLEILMQVCHAVEFAHSRGVVHRDIKPSNVMLGEFGEVYLVDWGVALDLARVDQARSAVVGTAAYMAPEMVSGEPADVSCRTDVFLLGAVLHEILTGQPRHEAPTLVAAMVQAHDARPASYASDVPPTLAALANRACARDPEARHPDVAAFRQAIATFLEHRGLHALLAATTRRTEALERAVAAKPDGEAERLEHDADVNRLFDQLRFAHEQLQASAPDLDGLAALRTRMLSAMLDHELARHNLPGALRLSRDLGAALTDAHRDALDRLQREEADKAALVEARARDQDPTLSRRQRALVGGSIVVFALGVLLQGLTVRDFSEPSPPLRLLITGLIPLLLVGGGGLVWRRRITFNEYNRRYFWMFAMIALGTAASRVSAFLAGMGSDVVLRFELLLLGVILVAARLPSRVPLGVGALFILCGLATSVMQAYSGRTYSLVTLVGGSIVVLDTLLRDPAPGAR